MADATWWELILGGLFGGGTLSAVASNLMHRHRETAEAVKIEADAAKSEAEADTELSEQWQRLVESQVTHLVKPLQDRVDEDSRQIAHLEEQQRKLFVALAYARGLGHWVNELCGVLDPEWVKAHPKPRLPDSIRPDIEGVS